MKRSRYETPEEKAELVQFFSDLAKEKNHKLIKVDPIVNKQKSVVHIKCLKCDTTFNQLSKYYLKNGAKPSELHRKEDGTYDVPYGCPTCAERFRKTFPKVAKINSRYQTPEQKEGLVKFFEGVAKERNQRLLKVDPIINKKKSVVFVKCLKCQTEFQKLASNYLRNGVRPSDIHIQEDGTYDIPNGCPNCYEKLKEKAPQLIRVGSGEAHWNWQGGGGGVGKSERTQTWFKNRIQYKEWRAGVFRVFNAVCFITGKKETKECPLNAHHLESYNSCSERRFDVSNGVLLTQDIHKEFHKYAGASSTTLDFEKFCNERYGITEFPWKKDLERIETIQQHVNEFSSTYKHQEFVKEIESRGFMYISGDYENKNSIYKVFCPKHQKYHNITKRNFSRTLIGVPCCVKESNARNVPNLEMFREKQAEMLALIAKRGYEYRSGDYKNKDSVYVIYCPKHQMEFERTPRLFKHATYGMPCCSNNRKKINK